MNRKCPGYIRSVLDRRAYERMVRCRGVTENYT